MRQAPLGAFRLLFDRYGKSYKMADEFGKSYKMADEFDHVAQAHFDSADRNAKCIDSIAIASR